MEDTISRKEHDEFARRIDEENERQNKRIEILENTVRQVSELTASVKVLATNMDHMLTEQKKQGERLERLESRDGEKWRTVVSYVLTLVLGALITFGLSRIGL